MRNHATSKGVLLPGVLCAAAVLTTESAFGLTPLDVEWCNSPANASVEQQISGCAAMVRSGRYRGRQLAPIYLNRGNAWLGKQDYDRAIADYDEAERFDPKLPAVFSNRGVAYNKRGDPDRAIANYDQAIRLDPKSPYAYNNRGAAYKVKGKLEDAFVDFDQAFRLDPAYTDALENRALVYDSDEKLNRALARFDEIVQKNPASLVGEGYFERGLVHFARGEYDEAIKDFSARIGWAPYGPAYWYRARATCAKGDPWGYSADLAAAIRYDMKFVDDHPKMEECPL